MQECGATVGSYLSQLPVTTSLSIRNGPVPAVISSIMSAI